MYHLTLIDHVKLFKKPKCVYTYVCVCVYIIAIFIAEPFEETEEKWLSSLENTRWLEYVRFVQTLSPFFFFEISTDSQEVQKH